MILDSVCLIYRLHQKHHLIYHPRELKAKSGSLALLGGFRIGLSKIGLRRHRMVRMPFPFWYLRT